MAFIKLSNAYVDFPIYNASNRSLKNRVLQVATGGKLGSDSRGHVIVRSIEDLSLEVQDGERVGLIGHNGAGKSTLLRLLSKVYEPSFGFVSVSGKIGSLIDISLGIDPEATGRENIFIRGGLLGISRNEIVKKFDEVVDFSELGDFIDMPVRTFSAGMHLRLAFSVSTIVRPEILLMDEWLSVGDESFKHKVELRMNELLESTSILVVATHSRDLALKVCNRVIWMEHGRIRMDGDPDLVCQAYFGV